MKVIKRNAEALAFSSPNPREFYNPKNGALDRIRRHQPLPLVWTHLSRGDIAEIRCSLTDALDRQLTILEREACLAIECILTTGRSLATLKKLRFYPTLEEFEEGQSPDQAFGLVAVPGELHWHLPEGNADRARSRKGLPRLGRKGQRIATVVIAASPLTVEIFKRHWRKPTVQGRIFASSKQRLRDQIQCTLENRKPDKFSRPRRMAEKLVTLERYLANDLVFEAGGDGAEALRKTDHVDHRIAPSAAYHLPGDVLSPVQLDVDDDAEVPPTEEIKAFIRSLRDDVERSRSDPSAHHDAFMAYSAELITFGTGSRVNFSSFPAIRTVDRETGFCQLHDKDSDEQSRARLIWMPFVVREQLSHYGAYLRHLARRSTGTFKRFGEYDSAEIVFPDKIEAEAALSIRDVLERSRQRHSSAVRLNIGRHWLRTHLLHRCSTETLHAFMGHWSRGMEPWSYGSFFDPLSYRVDLARTLPALLQELGWAPVRATLSQ